MFGGFIIFLATCWNLPCGAEVSPDLQRPFADKWAVVIGVDKFQDASWNLQYAVKDAEDFSDYLIKQANFEPHHVKLLTGKNATRRTISKTLREWLGSAAGPNDLAIIYFRSRGSFANLNPAGRNYLAASDTAADGVASTGIEMDEFPKLMLESVRARAVIMIIDADFSGLMTHAKSIGGGYGSLPPGLVPNGHTFEILCSARANEISWESKDYHNSVFTRHLIDALVKQGSKAVLPGAADAVREEVGREVRRARNRTESVSTLGEGGPLNVQIAAPVTKPRSAPAESATVR
jgi:uncharacterized caspase-like protein